MRVLVNDKMIEANVGRWKRFKRICHYRIPGFNEEFNTGEICTDFLLVLDCSAIMQPFAAIHFILDEDIVMNLVRKLYLHSADEDLYSLLDSERDYVTGDALIEYVFRHNNWINLDRPTHDHFMKNCPPHYRPVEILKPLPLKCTHPHIELSEIEELTSKIQNKTKSVWELI